MVSRPTFRLRLPSASGNWTVAEDLFHTCSVRTGKPNARKQNGFTLLEILVVLSLISIMFMLLLPRFNDSLLTDGKTAAARWIMTKARVLRENAVVKQQHYTLHVDVGSNRMWVSHEAMSEEEREAAAENGFSLQEGTTLTDVEFPGKNTVSIGRADIVFYKKGYSDKAMIHLSDEEDQQISLLLEPFIPQVALYETHVGLEE